LLTSRRIHLFSYLTKNTKDWYQANPKNDQILRLMHKMMFENCLILDPIERKYKTMGFYNWETNHTQDLFSSNWFCFFISESFSYDSRNVFWTPQNYDYNGKSLPNSTNKCAQSYWKQHNINLEDRQNPHAQWFSGFCINSTLNDAKSQNATTLVKNQANKMTCEFLYQQMEYDPQTCYWNYAPKQFLDLRNSIEYKVVEPVKYNFHGHIKFNLL